MGTRQGVEGDEEDPVVIVAVLLMLAKSFPVAVKRGCPFAGGVDLGLPAVATEDRFHRDPSSTILSPPAPPDFGRKR